MSHRNKLRGVPADRARRQPGQDRLSSWLSPAFTSRPRTRVPGRMFRPFQMHFLSLRCGILATAVKPDANAPSCSLKTETLRPTVARRAAIKVVPEEGVMRARKNKETEKRSAWLMALGR